MYFSDVGAFNEAFDQITMSGATTRTSIKTQNQMHPMYSMVLGPDHNLWAPDAYGNVIAQFTPAGVETTFPIPTQGASAQGITAGPDGALWFTEYSRGKIGRITTAGSITEYPITPLPGQSATGPGGITSGPDGALWFVDLGGSAIGRITTAGAITEFPNIAGRANGMSIVTGPDRAILRNRLRRARAHHGERHDANVPDPELRANQQRVQQTHDRTRRQHLVRRHERKLSREDRLLTSPRRDVSRG